MLRSLGSFDRVDVTSPNLTLFKNLPLSFATLRQATT